MITPDEVTAISGIGGAIVGAAISWVGVWQAQRGQSIARRTEVRREAYAGLIAELDYLERVWEAPETLAVPGDEKISAVTGEAVGRIQKAYGTVRLVGSEDSRAKAGDACSAAWDLSNLLNGPGENKLAKLRPAFDAFSAAAHKFLQQAETEVVP